jgi:hypothetical protein
MSQFVAPTGYVDLDNDCEFSLDRKSTRSRESVNPKEDLAFYFNTYIVPKYGLDNINVSNVASFMKELEMNWTKLLPDMKDKVMDIMVDGILNRDSSFRTSLLQKLNTSTLEDPAVKPTQNVNLFSKSTFGSEGMDKNQMIIILILVVIVGFFIVKK